MRAMSAPNQKSHADQLGEKHNEALMRAGIEHFYSEESGLLNSPDLEFSMRPSWCSPADDTTGQSPFHVSGGPVFM
jgi:hypothetical protein